MSRFPNVSTRKPQKFHARKFLAAQSRWNIKNHGHTFLMWTDCVHTENNKKLTDWDQVLMKTEQIENLIQSKKVFYGLKWKR